MTVLLFQTSTLGPGAVLGLQMSVTSVLLHVDPGLTLLPIGATLAGFRATHLQLCIWNFLLFLLQNPAGEVGCTGEHASSWTMPLAASPTLTGYIFP